jgi:hypothetical protein
MTIQVLPVGTRKFPETMAASRSLSLELVLAVEYRNSFPDVDGI